MSKILIKSSIFLNLIIPIFNAYGMEAEEFGKFQESEEPKLFKVFKEEDNDLERYSEYVATREGNFLLTCIRGKRGIFANQVVCYAVEEKEQNRVGFIRDGELFDKLKKIYIKQH